MAGKTAIALPNAVGEPVGSAVPNLSTPIPPVLSNSLPATGVLQPEETAQLVSNADVQNPTSLNPCTSSEQQFVLQAARAPDLPLDMPVPPAHFSAQADHAVQPAAAVTSTPVIQVDATAQAARMSEAPIASHNSESIAILPPNVSPSSKAQVSPATTKPATKQTVKKIKHILNKKQRSKIKADKQAAKETVTEPVPPVTPVPKTAAPIQYTLPPATLGLVTEKCGFSVTVDMNLKPHSNLPSEQPYVHCAQIADLSSVNIRDQKCLIYTGKDETLQVLDMYNALKKEHTTAIQAVCLVPHHMLKHVQPALENWSLVHKFQKKSYMLTKHYRNGSSAQEPGTSLLYVYIDTPARPVESPVSSAPFVLRQSTPVMSFLGKVSGIKVVIGTDTFASGHGYIHPSIVEQNRLTVRPIKVQLQLGDSSSIVECTEECLVHLNLGSYNCKVWLTVLSLPQPYDVLLGDKWLTEHKARLLYDKMSLEILTPKRKHTIKPMSAPAPVSYTPTDSPVGDRRILSYIQARRCLRKQHQHVLLFIDKIENSDEPCKQDPAVTPEHLAAVDDLIKEHSSIFGDKLQQNSEPRPDMPELIPIVMGSKIPNKPLYRYSPIQQAEIDKQVQEMLDQRLIEPSTSPYGAPVLLVKKPDGSWRFCVDYRALNAITVKNGHPLPRIDDLLDKIQGAKYFTSMDLLQGFYQLPLIDSDKPKIAFITTSGHYQFRVVSMDLSNSPSIFQRVMNQVF